MTLEQFEHIVQEALQELPQEFLEKLENIDICVEEFPSKAILKSLRIHKGSLLGLYSGVPFSKRSPTSYMHTLPDRIYLFKKNIESICASEGELKRQIQQTLLHELGHYFGLSDRRLRELGY